MCVVVFKPKGQKLPDEKRLRACFRTNPDGAGYMYPVNGKVKIKKGFMEFDKFYDSLLKDYGDNGDEKDFVLHFRISTQGGINKQCCHPFPVSKKMEDLYKTECESNLGVAHNGIISLTSEYSYGYYSTDKYGVTSYHKERDVSYSDTMKFITNYLSLILKNKRDMSDSANFELIEKLIGTTNKLAIMSITETKLVGSFEELDGIYYSNTHFTFMEGPFDITAYSNAYAVDSDRDEYPVLDDMSFSSLCGKAEACRRCMNFSDCYGMQMPIEWDTMTNEEIEAEIDAMFGGYYDT